MVVIAVRGEQAVRLEAGLGEQCGEELELVREVRGVDQDRLLAAPDGSGGGLPDAAGDDEDVAMEGDRSQTTFRSFAASRRVLTSSVGFFWFASSFWPLRFTQITGTFIFTIGSMSVS